MAPPPPPGRAARAGKGVIVALLVAWLAGLVGFGWLVLQPTGPEYPEAWDARILDLVDFVEAERELAFEHPVHVDFLTEAEFRPEVTSDGSDLSGEEREDVDAGTGLLRALGLVDGELDLFGAVNQLSGEGTLAFYDPATERIRVRGTELTPRLRGTIVHELTHALQDQHFDLQREGGFPVEGQNDTFRAVFEGDAERIQTAWVAGLSEADQEAWSREGEEQVGSADLGGVPDVLVQMFSAPYTFGQSFIDVLVAAEGKKAVDEALREPPKSEADLMDPFRYLANEEPAPVAVPELAPGERKLEDGAFGVFALYFMLAQQMDPARALAATDAWGGDAFVNFTRDDVDCVRVSFTGKDPAGTNRLTSALQDWARSLPSGAASVTREGDVIRLHSCDPGADAPKSATGDLDRAVALPLFRTQMALAGLDAGAEPRDAHCVAQHFVTALSPEELIEFAGAEEPSEAVLRAGAAARQSCGVEDD